MGHAECRKIFEAARVVRDLEIQCNQVSDGACTASLSVTEKHLQHLNVVHGGVITTLAGHAAAGAATTLIGSNNFVVASGFTAKLFKSVRQGDLRATATVIEQSERDMRVETVVTNLVNSETAEVARVTFNLVVQSSI